MAAPLLDLFSVFVFDFSLFCFCVVFLFRFPFVVFVFVLRFRFCVAFLFVVLFCFRLFFCCVLVWVFERAPFGTPSLKSLESKSQGGLRAPRQSWAKSIRVLQIRRPLGAPHIRRARLVWRISEGLRTPPCQYDYNIIVMDILTALPQTPPRPPRPPFLLLFYSLGRGGRGLGEGAGTEMEHFLPEIV